MNLIDEYEAHLISYEEFQHHLWGSGQQLINAVGLDKFIFYLNAAENEYYKEED
ncbi:hypothetical protein [Candidatus Enterococcus clewellii]|uniref:Uncharacterized protein n=1 Tax=Candidatus Enterococcus clewellii TaxID=1834193 RepID=A0A242K4A6_9ENTE|nr:hypothetical protein [Enterococcus sp. 9E7_DIV0242]OTP13452.1 hypothetical protein A5888_002930 [Enterococcus sp. 9E7_DIV0242]